MPTDDQPPRTEHFRVIRDWVIDQADWTSEEPVVPSRPTGLDTRLSAAAAAELRAANPEGNEATHIFFAVGESIDQEFNAIDPEQSHPTALSRPRRVFYAVSGLEMDINNGGLDQYYNNSRADCAHELPDMLREIGMPHLADLVARANAVFPKGPPANRSVRLAMFDHLGDDASNQWNELTNEYFKNNYSCQTHLVRHILAHESEFFKA